MYPPISNDPKLLLDSLVEAPALGPAIGSPVFPVFPVLAKKQNSGISKILLLIKTSLHFHLPPIFGL